MTEISIPTPPAHTSIVRWGIPVEVTTLYRVGDDVDTEAFEGVLLESDLRGRDLTIQWGGDALHFRPSELHLRQKPRGLTLDQAAAHLYERVNYIPRPGADAEAGTIYRVTDFHVFVLYDGDSTPKATPAEALAFAFGEFGMLGGFAR
jgi:hypothetical protein